MIYINHHKSQFIQKHRDHKSSHENHPIIVKFIYKSSIIDSHPLASSSLDHLSTNHLYLCTFLSSINSQTILHCLSYSYNLYIYIYKLQTLGMGFLSLKKSCLPSPKSPSAEALISLCGTL